MGKQSEHLLEHPIQVLIADDDEVSLLFLKQLLVDNDYQVISAGNGQDALTLALKHQPDIVLLDVNMPGLDGFEVCRQIKAHAKLRLVPIVFLSIQSEIQSKIQGLASGGIDYLTKPFDSDELLIRIHSHLEFYRLRQSSEAAIMHHYVDLDQANQVLREASQFLVANDNPYKKILSSLEEGVVRIDRDGICLFANDAAARLLGYATPGELQGECFKHLRIAHQGAKFDTEIYDQLLKSSSHEINATWHKKNGDSLPVEFRSKPFNENNGNTTIIITFTDISLRKNIESKVYNLAYKDALTGLSNRAFFMEQLKQEIENLQTREYKFAICLFDLDSFKQINDSFGHLAGDEVLFKFGRRLSSSVRSSRTVARLGGDEFGLIISGVSTEDELHKILQRISGSLQGRYKLSTTQVDMTVSMGVTICDGLVINTEQLLNQADQALYESKRKHNGQYCIYNARLAFDSSQEIILANQLSHALEAGELVVEYQPQFEIKNNTYQGAEALIRWNHPQKGFLLPSQFLPIAAKRGFIEDISNYAFDKTCQQIKKWKKENIMFGSISINLCLEQLLNKDFNKRIYKNFKENEIASKDICFELSNSDRTNLMDKNLLNKIKTIKKLGIGISISDIKINADTLNFLNETNPCQFKIDKEIFKIHSKDKNGPEVIEVLVNLGHTFGMSVIVEGVETLSQADFLRKIGCDLVQGFYYSKAISPGNLQEFFHQAEEKREDKKTMALL